MIHPHLFAHKKGSPRKTRKSRPFCRFHLSKLIKKPSFEDQSPCCCLVQGVPEKTHFQNATERPRVKNGRTDPRAHSEIPLIMTTEGF